MLLDRIFRSQLWCSGSWNLTSKMLDKVRGVQQKMYYQVVRPRRLLGEWPWYFHERVRGEFRDLRNRYQLHHVSDSHMAESVVAEKGSAMLHKATSPCGRLQQKPLSEPLVLTLNDSKVVKNSLKLSEKQKHLAEKKAVQLMQAHPNEHFQLQSLIKDCEDFLLSQQREEDWLAIGNSLPNPFNSARTRV